MRTHFCGDLNKTHVDTEVKLCGWAHRRRDHGGVCEHEGRSTEEEEEEENKEEESGQHSDGIVGGLCLQE